MEFPIRAPDYMNDTAIQPKPEKFRNSTTGNGGIDFPVSSVKCVPDPDSGLAVLIPSKNDELSVGSLVILARQYASHVIVVDDRSRDNTVSVAERAGAVVLNAGEYGGGRVNSILAGCRCALGYGCTAVVIIDDNGKHLVRDIPRLAEPILSGKADLVIGSRNVQGRKGIPHYRFNECEESSGLPEKKMEFQSSDPNSTFRAVGIDAIVLLDLLPDNEQFEPMMITLFSRRNLTIMDVAVTPRHDFPVPDENLDDSPLYRGSRVAVVVPAYNEELLIGETLSGIPDFVCRVYVVNDCSKDRTQDVIEYYAQHDDSVVPITHDRNQGVGAAIVTGYKRALADGMDVIAVMAGDNQMDPGFLPDLLDPVIDKKCDYTMGNRLINPEFRKGMSKWRYVGNSVLTLLTKIASGYWQMMDPQNGYTVISKRALESISLNGIYPRYGYCNDLLVKLNVLGFRVINVPHPARYGLEKSKIKYSTYIYRVSWLLLSDFLWRLKMKYVVLNFHPLVFFYMAGAVFSIVGFFGGLYSLYYKFVQGYPIFVPLTVTLLLFGFGLQMLFFAMFYDMQQEKIANGWYT
jgi:glycosyltransferase involved in cell wall biosynthesis